MPTSLVEPRDDAVALIPVTSASYPDWLAAQPPSVGRWLSGLGWKPSAGAVAALPSEDGTPAAMVVGVDDPPGFWALSGLPWTLPAGTYRLDRPADGRPLLAPSEIMLLPESCQLLFVQGCRPILAQKLRYFEERAFKGRWSPWRMEAAEDDPGALISADMMK